MSEVSHWTVYDWMEEHDSRTRQRDKTTGRYKINDVDLILTRARPGGGGGYAPFRFSWIAKKRRRRFLHSCLDSCSATYLKILGPGHFRSGHQVRSSDPTSEKLSNRVTAIVVEINI